MTAGTSQVFFLPVQQGQRLCIYHPPLLKPSASTSLPHTGCVLHIHAFAEEMNKCRRMAALTAGSLAARGVGVLQIDLYGCGDSSAEFADAEWRIWKSDIQAALNWLKQKHAGTVNLWADRLGALLALDFILTAEEKIDRLLLCQPVLDGSDYLNQTGAA
jgi:exosortase A-associated hydrolase 2